MPGSIYFISAKECSRIKIGWSGSVLSRLRALQTASPVALELILTVPATHNLEKAVHAKFSKYRAKDEWFFSCDEIYAFIELLRNGSDVITLLEIENIKEKRHARRREGSPETLLRDHLAQHY